MTVTRTDAAAAEDDDDGPDLCVLLDVAVDVAFLSSRCVIAVNICSNERRSPRQLALQKLPWSEEIASLS